MQVKCYNFNMEQKKLKILIKSVEGILYLLIIEFVLGMVTNLFATKPPDPKYFSEPLFIKVSSILHMLFGTLFPVFSIVLLLLVFKSKNNRYKKWAAGGFFAILFTTLTGFLTVLFKEEASETASLLMALGFIFSVIIFGKFYLILKQQQ